MALRSEQEVALRHRQHLRGFADQQLSIGADFVGFGVHFNPRQRIVQHHVALADATAALHRDEFARETERLRPAAIRERGLTDEREAGAADGAALARLRLGGGAEKVEFLLSLPDADEVVQALAPDEFALLVAEVGLNDAPELLALASPRQMQATVDLDGWQGGELDGVRVLASNSQSTTLVIMRGPSARSMSATMCGGSPL